MVGVECFFLDDAGCFPMLHGDFFLSLLFFSYAFLISLFEDTEIQVL